MLCFIFGHRPSGASGKLIADMKTDAFECRGCGARIKWNTQPKQIQAMRAEYLRRVSSLKVSDTRPDCSSFPITIR